MGDLYRETMRWIARVTNSGYILSVMWECDWDNLVRDNSEIKEHVESYSLSSPMTPQHALYGGRCKTCSFHASGTNTSVIKYVDVDVTVGLEYLYLRKRINRKHNMHSHENIYLYIYIYIYTYN